MTGQYEAADDAVAAESSPEDVPTASDNPLDELGVVLSLPKTIQVDMVDARDLGDYDLWFAITSLMLSTAVGFLTAWAQTPSTKDTYHLLLFVGLLFAALTAAAGATTFVKRRRLSADRQQVTFKVGRAG